MAGVIGAAAAAALIAFTSPQEGVSLHPYDDEIGGHVATVCYGETNAEMRTYTLAECQQMLDGSLAEYAAAVKKLTPGFDQLTLGQKVAVVDFTYNTGVGKYKTSTLRKRYSVGDFPGACDEFLRFRLAAGKDCSKRENNCYGLYKRRLAERSACRGEW